MKINVKIVFSIYFASTVAACGVSELPDDPCIAADRNLSLRALAENRVSNAYDACLYEMRREAIELISE